MWSLLSKVVSCIPGRSAEHVPSALGPTHQLLQGNFQPESDHPTLLFFTVHKAYEIAAHGDWPPPDMRHLWSNAHLRRKQCDPGLVVVQGKPGSSHLYSKAVQLTDNLFRQFITLRVSDDWNKRVIPRMKKWMSS